jgi:DNA-binding transcriptional MerR regulator
MTENERLSIGDLAKTTGTKIVTIRYYEQIGLLPVPSRTKGNYRAYDRGHRRRLAFIRRCRGLGFSLDQIRELLRLSAQDGRECVEVDRITAQHLADIEHKIADLKRLAIELRRLNACCQGTGVIANCRILEALSPDEEGDGVRTPTATRHKGAVPRA